MPLAKNETTPWWESVLETIENVTGQVTGNNQEGPGPSSNDVSSGGMFSGTSIELFGMSIPLGIVAVVIVYYLIKKK